MSQRWYLCPTLSKKCVLSCFVSSDSADALDKIWFQQVSLAMKITVIVTVVSIVIMTALTEYYTRCQEPWLALYTHYLIHFSKYLVRYILLIIQVDREGPQDTERPNNSPKATQAEKKQRQWTWLSHLYQVTVTAGAVFVLENTHICSSSYTNSSWDPAGL